ncbi:MAG: matrixin family metalloprotease [Myxococcales bacterium]|nr:matrixin family metalloprotease [Myxococcales bacterium]
MPRLQRLTLALALGVSALIFADDASAFCRTTTCDPKSGTCDVDAEGCVLSGLPLYWPGACVSFSVNKSATPLRGVDWETTETLVTQGFNTWLSVDCGGSKPSLSLESRSPVACDSQEYNQHQPNANIWMYRDDFWPYEGAVNTLALTTITFNVKTGEIFDADVEINSVENELTTTDQGVKIDMLSIVTHEAGHFLGLSHTVKGDATMYARYNPGSTSLRTLTADDAAGMCEIYPPGREADSCSFDPRHGFSGECSGPVDEGCSCRSIGAPSPGGSAPALGLLAIGLVWLRRRRV